MPRKTTFYDIYEDFVIFLIFIFCPIWAVQKVFKGHFSRSWRKSVPKTSTAPHRLKILNLTFSKFWPMITFIWRNVTEDLGAYLEVSQTRSMSSLGIISSWYGCFARKSQKRQKIKNFTLDLTFDVISDVTDKILQYFGKFKPEAIKCRLWIENRPISLADRGGGAAKRTPSGRLSGNTQSGRGLSVYRYAKMMTKYCFTLFFRIFIRYVADPEWRWFPIASSPGMAWLKLCITAIPIISCSVISILFFLHIAPGTFRDRSTKGLHHCIFSSPKLSLYGSLMSRSRFWHRQTRKVNCSWDIASCVFARSSCNAFCGSYL